MTENEEKELQIKYVYLLRCCARAVYRLEKNGLHFDADQIRAELATMRIELLLIEPETDLPVDDSSAEQRNHMLDHERIPQTKKPPLK